MARARNIKPSFFTNEVLGQLDPIICLLFSGLWCLADKDGILEDRPLRIKAELFPYREKLDVNGYLTELERCDFILRYKVGGVGYIYIKNFSKHQNPHNTEKSKGFPKPPALEGKSLLTPLDNGYSPADSLIPDSVNMIPESIPEPLPARFNPKEHLLSLGIDESVVKDWLQLRKQKKAAVTLTAIQGIQTEADKAFISLEDALRLCCRNGWQGFNASWLKGQHEGYKTALDKLEETGNALAGRTQAVRQQNIVDVDGSSFQPLAGFLR